MNRLRSNKQWLIGLLVLSFLGSFANVAWAEPVTVKTGLNRPWRVFYGEVLTVHESILSVKVHRPWLMRRNDVLVDVLTDAETQIHILGTPLASLTDMRAGDRIAVHGQRQADGTWYARRIIVVPAEVRLLQGKVGEIVDQTLVLISGDDRVRVLTDENTRILIPEMETPQLDDLGVGDRIVVAGSMTEEEDLLARRVRAVPQRPRRGAVLGRIEGIDNEILSLQTRQGLVRILIDEHTRFRTPSTDPTGLGDLEKGQVIGVAGVWNKDGSLEARIIGLAHRPIHN